MIKTNKFKNLLLFVVAIIFSVFCGKADKNIKNPKKVLALYLTKNVGDIIFATPVFRALKENYPSCKLYVIGSLKNKETLAYNQDVYEYIICPDTIFKLWKIIRRLNVDYALLFATSSFEITLLYLANIPSISVFSLQNTTDSTRIYKIIKRFCIQIPFYSGQNFARQNLNLLIPLGINSNNTKKHLFHSKQAELSMLEFFRKNKIVPHKDLIIAVAPGAGTKIKQWPADRFGQLADYLFKKYNIPIFVVGGPGDKKEFEAMRFSTSKETPIISCLGHSIDELKAFISNIDIMIANDSAPTHIAESYGKATVTIIGPTDEKEHIQEGKFNKIVSMASEVL